MAALRELAKQLPVPIPSRSHSDAIRRQLLHNMPRATSPRSRWTEIALVAAGACVLVAGGALYSARRPASIEMAALRGMVKPHGTAVFVHQRANQDEWVRLTEGAVFVEVQKLAPGERFRVVSSDGEVEVHGTAFETVVEHDHLRSVAVYHGRVEVRRHGSAALFLGPGERWQQAVPSPSPSPSSGLAAASESGTAPGLTPPTGLGSAAVPPSSTSLLAAKPTRASHRQPLRSHSVAPPSDVAARSGVNIKAGSATSSTPAESAFAEGWAALRRNEFAIATPAFARAILRGAGEPIIEDARFWYAVSLARTGDRAAAIVALRDFVTRHPTSSRLGEASSILGWQLLKAGFPAEARRRFGVAAQDPVAKIRDSGRAGLAASVPH